MGKIGNKGLTVKQQRFVDAYAGSVKEAAAIAGLSSAYCRNLMGDHTKDYTDPAALAVQTAIRDREHTESGRERIANRQERQEFWTKTMYDEKANMGDKLRASELLGKSEGDYIDRVVTTELTLADIAARVRSDRQLGQGGR